MNGQEGFYQKLRILEVREEVENFKVIVFEDGHGITYQAGQYLTLVSMENGEELRRSYSITASPVLNEPLSIGVKRVENGVFSRALVDRAKPGDELVTIGSGGLFVLPAVMPSRQQFFFLAAGSGITPIFSLLKTALHQFPVASAVLVYSNASPEKTIFRTELQSLQAKFPDRFQVEFLFSNATDLSRARLHRDLLLALVKSYRQDQETLFYVCGPESYLRLCTYTLQEYGIAPAQIKKENFYNQALFRRDALPPDRESHSVTIRIRNRLHKLTVHYPTSILRTAQQEGLALPYSCEAGRCGSCVAKCVGGTVWHSYNEVLTEKELQQGLVLTCVGHPVGGDVSLAF